MELATWNIVQTNYNASWEENSLLFTVEKSNHLSVCQQLSVVSTVAEGKTSSREISNPPLVCTAAAIQQNKIIPVAAYILDTPDAMINAKEYLFSWNPPYLPQSAGIVVMVW